MRWGALFGGLCLAALAMSVVAQNAGTTTENFETQPLDGWEVPPSASIQMVGRSNALVFNGPGIAMTPMTCGQSFTLTCRLRVQNGTANIVFCISGGERQVQEYRLIVNQEETALERAAGGAAQTLGGGETKLAGKPWAQLRLVRAGAQIQVSIDNQLILTGQDPNALPAGGLALGCLHGAGVAFDDLSVSSGGLVGQPAIPINIPGIVKPGAAPTPGPLQPQPGPVIGPMVAQPLPGTQPAGPKQAILAPGALAQVSQPIAPHMAQLMSRPPSRAEMVQALLANPQTAGLLQAIPRPPNLPLQALASTGLSGKPTQRVALVPAGPGAVSPNAAAAQLTQQGITRIWESGVSFTPSIARPAVQAGGITVALGVQRVQWVVMEENLADVTAANAFRLQPYYKEHSLLMHWELHLPPGAAPYMLALKIADSKVGAPASYVGGDPPLLMLGEPWSFSPVPLVPLQDGSGYVGLSNLQPHPSGPSKGVSIGLWITPQAIDQLPQQEHPSNDYVFGGMTVTRL